MKYVTVTARGNDKILPVQIVKKLIQKRQDEIKKIYPGLTCFKEGVRQIPVESIPGVGKFIDLLFSVLARSKAIDIIETKKG